MKRIILAGLMLSLVIPSLLAQQPQYTRKRFVSRLNSAEFKDIVPKNDGMSRSYLSLSPPVWDVDDANQTYIFGVVSALVCVEGPFKQGKKNGLFTFYVIDSVDHSKKYKIWEQDIVNNQLNGQWKTYGLNGKLVSFKSYLKDSLSGVSKEFGIDGKVTEEREYSNGRSNFKVKTYSKGGHIESETTIANGQPNGPAKKYYPNGTLMDEVILKNGELNGSRKYYYTSGAIWVEYEYKAGNPWNIIANYDEKGVKRNPGTLKNGNGTIILYNEDGGARETVRYENGIQVR